MTQRFGKLILVASLTIVSGCSLGRPDWIATGRHGIVATDSPYASQVGLEVLRAGGNAVDAATAVSFALAVTRPYSTGLGGGGFMLYWSADTGDVSAYDFRETAPASASANMYSGTKTAGGRGPHPSRYGYLAVGVPGLLAGRIEIQERLGTRPLAELIAPAIKLAREGFAVDADYARNCRDVLEVYRRQPHLRASCNYVWRHHLREGRLRKEGSMLVQPALARLLETVAQKGGDAFYRGEIADAIVATIRNRGGILTAEDLADYRMIEREPIRATYRGYELLLMPPPSSGGVCLAETLNILETFDLPAVARRDRPLALHYVAQAMKHAFADRARWLGDADFTNVPVELLTHKAYARQLSLGIGDSVGPTDPDAYGASQIPDDAGTSHFSIIDRWGNVVSSTETINTAFGSLAAVDEWGLILNNQMDDFTAVAGQPNAFGLVQSQKNAIAPGKRPLSSMSPTIVLEDGKPVLALGASGGPRIISSVANVFLALTDFGMNLSDAMIAIRVHHQWQPDTVAFDQYPPRGLAERFRAMGYSLDSHRKTGVVQLVRIENYQLSGASDPRKGGRPTGY
jgi:gamma-glutamyltranspeptidase / glutathione hydrolase